MKTHEDGQPGALALGSCSGFVSVADIFPFWRYAVGPTSQRNPAIPFYRLAPALAFFEEAKRELPWAGVTLYRRRWWRGVETVKEYIPNR